MPATLGPIGGECRSNRHARDAGLGVRQASPPHEGRHSHCPGGPFAARLLGRGSEPLLQGLVAVRHLGIEQRPRATRYGQQRPNGGCATPGSRYDQFDRGGMDGLDLLSQFFVHASVGCVSTAPVVYKLHGSGGARRGWMPQEAPSGPIVPSLPFDRRGGGGWRGLARGLQCTLPAAGRLLLPLPFLFPSILPDWSWPTLLRSTV